MRLIALFFILRLGIESLTAQPVSIIVSPEARPSDLHAAEVLQHYLSKITTKQIPLLAVSPIAGRSRPIFVGACEEALRFGIQIPAALPQDAFFMQGNEGAFAIAGGGELGTEYGVYSFLERLGCRFYTPRDSFIPEIKNLKLPEIPPIVEAPAFPYRELWYEPAMDDGWARRQKLKTQTRKKEEWGLFVHTFEKLCPSHEFFTDHPEYFAYNGAQRSPGQLCLSNDTVLQLVTEHLRKEIAQKPEARYWSVSQNDNYDYCKCARCAAADRYYGSPAGTLLAFVNRVATQFPEKIISTLAYQYTRQAPKNIIPARNVSICLCSIECNRGKSIEDGCPDFARDVREWSAITKNLMIWDYVVQFRSYVSPFPNWQVLQPNLQFFQKQGVQMMFEQGSGHSRSEFSDMRAYLLAKLMWNPKANMDSILTDFGKGYYGADRKMVWQLIHDQTERLNRHGKTLLIYDIPQNEPFVKDGFYDRFGKLEILQGSETPALPVAAAALPEIFAYLENLKSVPLNDYDPTAILVAETLLDTAEIHNMLDSFEVWCRRVGYLQLNENGYTPEQYNRDYRAYLRKALEARNSRAGNPRLTYPASRAYAGGNAGELCNLLVGETDYRSNWLGWQGADMQAIFSVEGEKAGSISVSFLQDQASWVFFPEKVTLEISADGEHFQTLKEEQIPLAPDGKKALKTIAVQFPEQPVKAVRVTAVNTKTCPPWHTCNGNPCWIFADEVVVN